MAEIKEQKSVTGMEQDIGAEDGGAKEGTGGNGR